MRIKIHFVNICEDLILFVNFVNICDLILSCLYVDEVDEESLRKDLCLSGRMQVVPHSSWTETEKCVLLVVLDRQLQDVSLSEITEQLLDTADVCFLNCTLRRVQTVLGQPSCKLVPTARRSGPGVSWITARDMSLLGQGVRHEEKFGWIIARSEQLVRR